MNQIVYAGKHSLTYKVSRHAHASWEFIYCTGGEGTLIFDETVLSYGAGEIAVIPPYVPHSNESGIGFTNIHINMAEPTLTFQTPLLVRDDSNQFILHAFEAAFYHFSAPGKTSAALLSGYGILLPAYLLDHHDAPLRSAIVSEIENSIIRNYPDSGFELDAYLHALPFNYDYLRKLFKKEIGITPHRYLMDQRLQMAAEFLSSAYTEDSGNISEISRMCGFREPLYFSRMFKKKYGVSPTLYQRRSQPDAVPRTAETMKIMLDDA